MESKIQIPIGTETREKKKKSGFSVDPFLGWDNRAVGCRLIVERV